MWKSLSWYSPACAASLIKLSSELHRFVSAQALVSSEQSQHMGTMEQMIKGAPLMSKGGYRNIEQHRPTQMDLSGFLRGHWNSEGLSQLLGMALINNRHL